MQTGHTGNIVQPSALTHSKAMANVVKDAPPKKKNIQELETLAVMFVDQTMGGEHCRRDYRRLRTRWH